MSDKKSKNNSGLYVAVFFVAVLLILILFMVKKNQIASNLQKTNFFERVGVTTPEFVKNAPAAPEAPADVEIDLMGEAEEAPVFAETAPVEEYKPVEQPVPVVEETKPVAKEEVAPAKPAEKPQPTKPAAVPNVRKTTLYFVNIGSDGSVNRKSVVRELPKSDSPLTDSIKALLSGPVPSDGSCRNLIPSGTKLIGASVKDGVATLNFNDAFEFNGVGVEGSIAQLMQIVYTATEFSTVKSVQFLIEGEKKEYLTEGIWIGSPLSRGSF